MRYKGKHEVFNTTHSPLLMNEASKIQKYSQGGEAEQNIQAAVSGLFNYQVPPFIEQTSSKLILKYNFGKHLLHFHH